MMVELQLVRLVTLEPWKMLTAEISPISDHEERDMHNDQDIVGGDNFDEFFENNSDDDTVSMHHKKV